MEYGETEVRVAGSGPLPDDTNITDMGLSPGEQALLTPNARKLTKGDLLTIRGIYQDKRELNGMSLLKEVDDAVGVDLTVEDLHSIQDAFTNLNPALGGGVTAAASCCCCTCSCCPCCSCSSTASVVIDPTAAPARPTWRMLA